MTLPSFNSGNLLPPFVGSWPSHALGFSPYPTSVLELATKFGTNSSRQLLLKGFLALRRELRAIGVNIHYQWLDGSFVENIEVSQGRTPNDIDVVTFLERPNHSKDDTSFAKLVSANKHLFLGPQCKPKFSCDHYQVDLDAPFNLQRLCYWHSLFSHSRDGAWKGYLMVEGENQAADDAALLLLTGSGSI